MEATTRITTRNSARHEVTKSAESEMTENCNSVSKMLRSSQKKASHDSDQGILSLFRNNRRPSPGGKKRIVGESEPINISNRISRSDKTDIRFEHAEVKLRDSTARKTRSSKSNNAAQPFSQARVFIVIDGVLQRIPSISSTDFLSSTTSSTSHHLVLEAPRQCSDHVSRSCSTQESNDQGKANNTTKTLGRKGQKSDSSTIRAIDKMDTSKNKLIHKPGTHTRQNNEEKSEYVRGSQLRDDYQSASSSKENGKGDYNSTSDTDRGYDSADDGHLVKVIDTSSDIESKHDDYLSRLRTRLPRRTKSSKMNGDENFDENTLELLINAVCNDILQYENNKLGRYSCEILIEEDIELFMLRMSRLAEDHVSHEFLMRAEDGSDKNEIHGKLYSVFLSEVEENSLWQDYFRKNVSEAQKAFNGHRLRGGETAKLLDKRTLNWVKRSVTKCLERNRVVDGYHSRNLVPTMAYLGRTDNLSSEANDSTPRTIATRHFIRDRIRNCKRQSRDNLVEILCIAADQISPATEALIMQDVDSSVEQQDNLMQKDSLLLEPQSSELDLRRKLQKQQNHDHRNATSQPSNLMMNIKHDFPSLRDLDAFQQKIMARNQASTKRRRLESESDFIERKNIDLGKQLRENSIVHRLPRWKNFLGKQTKTVDEQFPIPPSPLRLTTNISTTGYCNHLTSVLNSRTRLFARYEFFYCDLDRGWYNQNAFADISKQFGVNIGTHLSRREWKAIRRRIQNKPRRFSKRFIQSQLSRRNMYRNKVRMLQRNNQPSSFPGIPAPACIGSTVDAYCKTYRIVQRGKVIDFDADSATYRIEFDNQQFGWELCPDSDVASRSNACILSPIARSISCNNCLDDIDNKFTRGNYCSTRTLLSGGSSLGTHKSTKIIAQSVSEQVAELEAFLVLLKTIEQARYLKNDVLSILDDASSMIARHMPLDGVPIHAEKSSLPMSKSAREHIDWLVANLDRVGLISRTAMNHLQKLYTNS